MAPIDAPHRLENKANMFESRISSYQKARVMSAWSSRDASDNEDDEDGQTGQGWRARDQEFRLDADF
jgi:hypothetical protein